MLLLLHSRELLRNTSLSQPTKAEGCDSKDHYGALEYVNNIEWDVVEKLNRRSSTGERAEEDRCRDDSHRTTASEECNCDSCETVICRKSTADESAHHSHGVHGAA